MDWSIERIEEMITGKIEESLTLDYKRAAALDKSKSVDIAKDVSAFANSAGGTLVYGVTEDSNNRHLPRAIDPVQRKLVTKEWIESIILGNIQPKVEGVVIHPVVITDGECLYVIDIPASTTAHQASDWRYYKRHNFSSVPMEDYEIRDVMNRSKHPRLGLEFHLKLYTPSDPMGMPTFGRKQKEEDLVSLQVMAINEGTVMAHYIVVKLLIPTQIAYASLIVGHVRAGTKKLPATIPVTITNKKQDRAPMGNVLSDVRFEPILPELSEYLGSCSLTDDAWITTNQDLEVSWRIHVDNAPSRSGVTKLKEMARVDGRRAK